MRILDKSHWGGRIPPWWLFCLRGEGKGRTPLPQAFGCAIVWLRAGMKGWNNEDSTSFTWDPMTTSYIKMQNQVVSQGMVTGRRLEVRELCLSFPWGWRGSHFDPARPRAPSLLKSKPDLVTKRQPWFRREDPLAGRGSAGQGREDPCLL